jgi:hypothetical protein
LQVHGVVADGSIEQAKGTLVYRFKIQSRPDRPAAMITATYEGLVPDTFKSGAEVIVKGTLTADNQGRRRSRRHHGEVPVQVQRGRTGQAEEAAAGPAGKRRPAAQALRPSTATRRLARIDG